MPSLYGDLSGSTDTHLRRALDSGRCDRSTDTAVRAEVLALDADIDCGFCFCAPDRVQDAVAFTVGPRHVRQHPSTFDILWTVICRNDAISIRHLQFELTEAHMSSVDGIAHYLVARLYFRILNALRVRDQHARTVRATYNAVVLRMVLLHCSHPCAPMNTVAPAVPPNTYDTMHHHTCDC